MGALNSGSAFTLALYRAIGHMERGCCRLCLRNKYIKAREFETAVAITRYETGIRVLNGQYLHNKAGWKPKTQQELELQEWVERSFDRKRPTREDLEKPDFEWHECDGVDLKDLAHEDIYLTYVDDLITAYKASECLSRHAVACLTQERQPGKLAGCEL